jgi:hypothetical protein
MPEIKNNFIKGKMNKDLDERLIQKGEYREAQNVALSESDDSDSGALEILLGNIAKNIATDLKDASNNTLFATSTSILPEVIGYVGDVKNKRVIYFVTNFSGTQTDDIRAITRAAGAGSDWVGGTAYNINPRTGSSPSLDQCAIVLYDIQEDNTIVLAYGPWLNFSIAHLITGAQVIDDLLYWTDNYNQPRKINIAKAKATANYYTCEEQISLAKYAPYSPVQLLNRSGYWAEDDEATDDVITDKTNGSIKSEYMRDKFIRFSYRYKFEDGEYSIMAPFTQIVFEPLNNGAISDTEDTANAMANQPTIDVSKHSVYRKTTVDLMQNAINKVVLRIPMPNLDERDASFNPSFGAYANDYKIDSVEILIKESDGLAIRSVKSIKVSEMTNSDFDWYSIKPSSTADTYKRQTLKYVYKSEQPIKVLPEDQLIRVYDQVPLMAKALDIVGNRVILANYVENYQFPKDQAGKRGIDYTLGVDSKGDQEFGQTHGLIQKTFNAYKFHSIKQRRTYQVGMVFADKYGRQSPVVLSSSTANDADTITTSPVTSDYSDTVITTATGSTSGTSTTVTLTADNTNIAVGMEVVGSGITTGTTVASITDADTIVLSAAFALSGIPMSFKHHSWTANQIAYGEGLAIIFNDLQLFQSLQHMYNGTFSATFNPHGWYSYKIVVKQSEQDYYNIYASHPFDGWDNIEDESNTSRDGGKSFLSLYGDNINKVPRSINDTDLNRKGVMGSEERLYPKVVFSTSGASIQNAQLHEPGEVITLGDAFEQNLYMSGDDNASGTGGFSIYNFIYSKDRNPLIAELPNLKVYHASGTGNSTISEYYVHTTTDKSDEVKIATDMESNNSAIGSNDDFNGYSVNATNLAFRSDNKTVKVLDYASGANNNLITMSSLQTLTLGDRLLLTRSYEGLSVFETEPFKSNIDIYYETGTCGLVEDLNEELSDTSAVVNAPDNFTSSATSFPEGTSIGGTIATIDADDNASPDNLSFSVTGATLGDSTDVSGKIAVNSSTGVLTATGGFRHHGGGSSRDTVNVNFQINDPNSGSIYPSQAYTVTPSVPTFTTSSTSASLSPTAGSNVTVYTDSNVTNGSSLTNENHYGASNGSMTVTWAMGSSAYNTYFLVTISGNTMTVKTTSSWTQSNAQSFFIDSTASNRVMTITVNDGMASNNTTTMNLTIAEGITSETGALTVCGPSECDACQEAQSIFYATVGTGTVYPTVDNSELRVHVGNLVYTNSTLTTFASAGFYLYQTAAVSPGFWCVQINSSGSVTSVTEIEECDDRESPG